MNEDMKRRTRSRVWLVALTLGLLPLGAGVSVYLRPPPATPEKAEGVPARPVRTAAAQTESIPLVAEYRGELTTEAAELSAEGTGRVLEVRKQLGEPVKKGEVVAVIDASETRRTLAEAQAQEASCEAAQKSNHARLEAARVEAKRAAKLAEVDAASEQEVLALEAQVKVLEAEGSAEVASCLAAAARVQLVRTQLAKSQLVAPFDGLVAERFLDPGASVSPGTPVLRIVRGGKLQVRFRASEQHLRRLKQGLPISVSTLAGADARLSGNIERIGAEVSRVDRSVAVEGVLAEESPSLKPGMYAVIRVELGRLDDAITVPSSALVVRVGDAGQETAHVVAVENGRAKKQEVGILGTFEDRTAVSGLKAGTRVVVFGQEAIPDGAPLRELE